MFNALYDVEIISKEAFFMWKKSTLHPKGKGVTLKSLTSFFVCISDDLASDEEDSPADDSSFLPVKTF